MFDAAGVDDDKNPSRREKNWSIGVSIPVPRACKARTLPIELMPCLKIAWQVYCVINFAQRPLHYMGVPQHACCRGHSSAVEHRIADPAVAGSIPAGPSSFLFFSCKIFGGLKVFSCRPNASEEILTKLAYQS